MKVTLYMATSIDGYIATPEGNSDWISEIDIALFDKKCAEADCIIVGNTTYTQYEGDLYPIEGKRNIILSKNSVGDFAHSPIEAIEEARQEGLKNILLVGGGNINGSFLKENLIDDIIIDIQPIILGKGIKLFEKLETIVNLTYKSTSTLEGGLVVIHYEVQK